MHKSDFCLRQQNSGLLTSVYRKHTPCDQCVYSNNIYNSNRQSKIKRTSTIQPYVCSNCLVFDISAAVERSPLVTINNVPQLYTAIFIWPHHLYWLIITAYIYPLVCIIYNIHKISCTPKLVRLAIGCILLSDAIKYFSLVFYRNYSNSGHKENSN